jgi:uncharacterized protein YuzE
MRFSIADSNRIKKDKHYENQLFPGYRHLTGSLFSDGRTEDTRDLDENTLADYDRDGNLLSLTMEHASKRADVNSFSFTNPSLVHAAA